MSLNTVIVTDLSGFPRKPPDVNAIHHSPLYSVINFSVRSVILLVQQNSACAIKFLLLQPPVPPKFVLQG